MTGDDGGAMPEEDAVEAHPRGVRWCQRRLQHAAWSYGNAVAKARRGEAKHAEVVLRHAELIEAVLAYHEARDQHMDHTAK